MGITTVSTSQSTLRNKWGHSEIASQRTTIRQCPPDELTSLWIRWGRWPSPMEIWLRVQWGLLISSVTHFYAQAFQYLLFKYIPWQNCKLLHVQNLWDCSLIISIRGTQLSLPYLCMCWSDFLSQCLLHLLKSFATKIYVLL